MKDNWEDGPDQVEVHNDALLKKVIRLEAALRAARPFVAAAHPSKRLDIIRLIDDALED